MVEDKLLYQDFLNGNKEAFEELVIKYKNNLIYFISRYTKNLEAAEDIFQDVMLFILENQNYYNSDYSFKTYMYMIAKSKALNYIKSEKNTENIDDQEEELKEENLLEEIVLAKERKKKIQNVINKMPIDYQLVIYLTKVEELSYKETALIMNKKETEIKKLSYNARKKFKKLLIERNIIEIRDNKILKMFVFLIITSVIFSSAVIAKFVIYNLFFSESKGISTAIDNGYITNSNLDYIYSNDIGLKIGNIVMDNSYLGISFEMKYNIEEYDLFNISFENIIVYDENNCILYCNNENMFNEFCKNKEESYSWGECNEKYINSGLSIYNANNINCIYNLYANEFPKSKELFVDVQNIVNQIDKKTVIDGSWHLNIKLTEEMYNREHNKFKNTNSIENLEIVNVDVSKTNTQVNFILKGNIPWDEIFERQRLVNKLYDEGKTLQEISEITDKMEFKSNSEFDAFKDVYIENIGGEKFYQDFDLPEGNRIILDEESDFINVIFTMSLTEYNCTDLLYFNFSLGGQQYNIELIKK